MYGLTTDEMHVLYDTLSRWLSVLDTEPAGSAIDEEARVLRKLMKAMRDVA
jgi:hypothetical protein